MAEKPKHVRAVTFIDGQNLFYSAKNAFGYDYPNYNPLRLSQAFCKKNGWNLSQVRFYTGIPSKDDNDFWNAFWTNKAAAMNRAGVHCHMRTLVYRDTLKQLQDGSITRVRVGFEKGIDVRIALDLVRMARTESFDVAVIFSQDQDLAEAAIEIKSISKEQDRWIGVVSAYPEGQSTKKQRGIDQTMWLPFDKELYCSCLDARDFRPRLP